MKLVKWGDVEAIWNGSLPTFEMDDKEAIGLFSKLQFKLSQYV